jgi:hypothetical protein
LVRGGERDEGGVFGGGRRKTLWSGEFFQVYCAFRFKEGSGFLFSGNLSPRRLSCHGVINDEINSLYLGE